MVILNLQLQITFEQATVLFNFLFLLNLESNEKLLCLASYLETKIYISKYVIIYLGGFDKNFYHIFYFMKYSEKNKYYFTCAI